MTEQSDARAIIARRIDEYRKRRFEYYASKNLLTELLKKDPLLPALRGATSARQWLADAFAAHESSSEEGVMGNTWQKILGDLTSKSVGGSDFLFEKDEILWVLEIKTQTNTTNANSIVQILRGLQAKVRAHSADRVPGRRGVRPAIGILRGPPTDIERVYKSTSSTDKDIDNLQYRYLVGRPFLTWLTGIANPASMVDLSGAQALADARKACLLRLEGELLNLLAKHGLTDDIASVIDLASRS